MLVEGVNRVKKHTKIQTTTRGAQEGGIVHQEAPIHVSNVQVVCPTCGEAVAHRPPQGTKKAATSGPAASAARTCRPGSEADDSHHTTPAALPRLKQRYRDEIIAALREQFSYANVMQVPTLVKVKVNMGVGDAARDGKLIEGAVRDLDRDHRPAARDRQGAAVDRAVQAA